MPEEVTQVKVFVASPGDVTEERARLDGVVDELNRGIAADHRMVLQLERWETHARPGIGVDAQDVINRQFETPDIFVGLFWKRLGTPTHRASSGTVEEIQSAIQAYRDAGAMEIFVYFNQEPYNPTHEDLAQVQGVQQFRKRLETGGLLVWEYTGPAEFEAKVRGHLTSAIRNWSRPGPRPPAPPPPPGAPASGSSRGFVNGLLRTELDVRSQDRVDSFVGDIRGAVAALGFAKPTGNRLALVLYELLGNVGQHGESPDALVEIEANTGATRSLSIDVYQAGKGFDLERSLGADREAFHTGEREHGLLKIARVAGDVHLAHKERDSGRTGVGCYLYELEPINSGVFTEFPFMAPVAFEYDVPRRCWMGDVVYVRGDTQHTLLYALGRGSSRLLDLYLGHLRDESCRALGIEYTGHVNPSEVLWPTAPPLAAELPRARSADPLQAALEVYFPELFDSGRVVLLANEADMFAEGQAQQWAARWGLPAFTDLGECRRHLEELAVSDADAPR